jgi:hypothetical protein
VVGAERVSVYKVLRRALLHGSGVPGAEPVRRWLDGAIERDCGEAQEADVLVVRPQDERLYKDDVRVVLPEVDAAYRAELLRR